MGKPWPAPDPSPAAPAVVPVAFSPFHNQSHVQSPGEILAFVL